MFHLNPASRSRTHAPTWGSKSTSKKKGGQQQYMNRSMGLTEIKEIAILHTTQVVKGIYLGMGALPLDCPACIATPTIGALDHRRHGSQRWRCCWGGDPAASAVIVRRRSNNRVVYGRMHISENV